MTQRHGVLTQQPKQPVQGLMGPCGWMIW